MNLGLESSGGHCATGQRAGQLINEYLARLHRRPEEKKWTKATRKSELEEMCIFYLQYIGLAGMIGAPSQVYALFSEALTDQ